MPHSKTQIYNGDFRYLQQMYIFSCFRFELSFPIDTKQIAVQRENARSSTSPTRNRCGSNGQREQTFPRLPDSTVNWDSLSILIMISDKQRRAKFTLILFTERRHVGRGGIIHLKQKNQCNYLGFMTIVHFREAETEC